MRELSEEEFHATFAEPMRELGEDEESVVVSLAEIVEEAIRRHSLPTTSEDIDIHHISVNGTNTYTHVVFGYGIPNEYLVAVIDHSGPAVYGYHLLDLNEKYGLGVPEPD